MTGKRDSENHSALNSHEGIQDARAENKSNLDGISEALGDMNTLQKGLLGAGAFAAVIGGAVYSIGTESAENTAEGVEEYFNQMESELYTDTALNVGAEYGPEVIETSQYAIEVTEKLL